MKDSKVEQTRIRIDAERKHITEAIKAISGPEPDWVRYGLLHIAAFINPEPERTCHVILMDMAGKLPYRKGDMILNELSDGCSECGYPFDTVNNGVPDYCPYCGAKVMES